MANYNVGNIEIGVQVNNKNSVSEINTLIQKINQIERLDKAVQDSFISINKLSNGLLKLQKTDLNNLTSRFEQISNATKILNDKLANIGSANFSDVASSLNRLGNAFRQFDKLKDFDFRKMYESFNSLNRIITPFLTKLKESEASLIAMNGVLGSLKTKTITKATNELGKADTQTNKLANNSSKANKNFNQMFNIGKIYFFINYSKRMVQTLAKFITYASDYIEILNKFQVSFGSLYQENLKLTNQLAQAFGFSTNTLLDYTATFNNMLKGLKGLNVETSATISQTLTKMAIDYASLFNVSIDRAMTAFQSAISGNIRTIRQISGFDVSETTIFSVYQQMGGTKTMRQLNQLEKRLLRIIAIQQQMEETGAMGDYGRTISTVSNEVKIMKEQLIEVGKWIGMNLLVYIKPIITYTNAILFTITEIAKSMANILQFTKDIDYEEEFASFGSGVEDATENVEDLKQSLLSLPLDKLNVLGDSGSTSNVSGLSVEGNILNALKEYNMNLDKVNYKAKEMSKSMLTWLGYTSVVNEETGEISWNLKNGKTNLSTILSTFKSIGSLIIAFSIGKKLKDIISTITTLGKGVTMAFSPIGVAVGTIALISVAFVDLYNKNENLRESINTSLNNISEKISIIWDKLKEFYVDFKPVLDWIWMYLGEVGAFFVSKILTRVELLLDLITGDFKGALNTIQRRFEDIGNVIARIFGLENWEQLAENIKKPFMQVGEWFKNSWFGDLFNWFVKIFGEIGRMFNEYLLPLIKGIGENIYNFLNPIFTTISNFINENIIPNLKLLGVLIQVIFVKKFNEIKEGIANLFNGITSGYKVFINFIISGINTVIKGINKISFNFPDWIPGIGGKSFGINIPKIPMLAQGGVINQPTMAMVGEYQGAKSNPEIVTPENKMRNVFTESMTPIANAIFKSNEKVIKAIENQNLTLNVNGRKLAESTYNDYEQVATRKGKLVFSTNT